MKKASVLLDILTVKDFTFSNRYVCAPFDIATASVTGLVTEELLSIYEQRKGPSLIVVEQAAITLAGQLEKN
ncbi:MAG: NADH:flavin oxidoreductase [Clostridiales bacterium]|jgi:2,4-dienoyl-CoA reductase-like NADH-dependent reductase (Old Yellow Enzyme family)|nr:NADH:flavin oxidoreductase [Clostridiales bacterium]